MNARTALPGNCLQVELLEATIGWNGIPIADVTSFRSQRLGRFWTSTISAKAPRRYRELWQAFGGPGASGLSRGMKDELIRRG